MKRWIYDSKRWQDVFTPKSYDFLSLVSEMTVPWFDKTKNQWVDKEEYDKEHKDNAKAEENKIAEADRKVREEPVIDEKLSKMIVADTDDGEDLPF